MSTFLDIGAIGVAATQDGLLFTAYEGQPGQASIFKATGDKEVSVFAPNFPTAPGGVEKYIDVNPGLGQWANKVRFVYVTQGRDIFEITPNGCTVKLFAQIHSDVADHTGITFDRVGTFNYDMILTDITGNVFRVSSDATVSPIANLKRFIENPAVVPATLGPHGGEIWVAAENDGAVYSVNASGQPTLIADNIPKAEGVTVIPAAPTNLGSSGACFAADFGTRILEFPASAFFGLGGNVLVGTDSPGPLRMISFTSGSGYVVSTFQDNLFKTGGEGVAFVQTLSHPFIYAAKFVCGCFEPRREMHTDEGPVEPGSYATAINVHNPNYCPVTIVKKAVLLFEGTEKDGNSGNPRPPYQLSTVELGPDWGLEIDCSDIRKVLLRQPSGNPGPKAPIFIKGWVVIESPDPLDVVAVYTVRGLDKDSGVSIETDRVVPTRLS